MPARRAAPSANPPPRPARGPAKGPTRGALLAALAERERELAEAREHQAATAEVLTVIASSPSDTQPVFQAIAESAKRLLGGYTGGVFLYTGDWTHGAALTSISPEADAAAKAMWPQRRSQNGSPFRTTLRRHGFAEIADTEAELEGIDRDQARARGYRSVLGCCSHSRRGAVRSDHRHAQGAGQICPTSHPAAANLRRPGRDRDPERAAVRQGAGQDQRSRRGAAIPDRDRRRLEGDQPFDVRPADRARHAGRLGREALRCRSGGGLPAAGGPLPLGL